MEQYAKTIGENIRRFRKEYGWTQEELADRVHINNGYLSHIEHGEKIPSVETLEKLASVLHRSVQGFFAPPKKRTQL